MKPTRVKPTKATEHQVREECGQACANPKCREWSTASHEIHHIDGDRSNTVKTNLLLFCGTCHNKEIAGVISEADVRLWKRMAEAGALPPPKGQAPASFGDAVNVSHTNNSGIIANRVTIQGKAKAAKIILPGSIATDAKKYNYVEYLVKRLTKFREAGGSYGQKRKGKIHDGGTRKILGEQLDGLPKDQPIEHFEKVVAHIKGKIDNTALGRNRRSDGKHTIDISGGLKVMSFSDKKSNLSVEIRRETNQVLKIHRKLLASVGVLFE